MPRRSAGTSAAPERDAGGRVAAPARRQDFAGYGSAPGRSGPARGGNGKYGNGRAAGKGRQARPMGKAAGGANGLRRGGAPNPAPRRAVPGNPQQAGYRPGARANRRITNSEKRRIRRRRKILGILCVLGILALGVMLSINLLFKVTGFRVENLDKSTPANTGIYTEEQILEQLGVQKGDNLFGFSTAEKTNLLAQNLPYLDAVEVRTSMPGTVIVRVQPATERFAVQIGATWAVLSDSLRVLRTADAQPDGPILLQTLTDAAAVPTVGQTVAIQAMATVQPDDNLATLETAQTPTDAASTLSQLMESLTAHDLLDGTGVISLSDLSELSFLYQGRVSVKLGTVNNLDYKMRYAANEILDQDGKGLADTDRGTLDVSYQREDGDIWAYFTPAEDTPADSAAPADAASGDVPADSDAAASDAGAGENADSTASVDSGQTDSAA
jgi:cell division protein FtsQ